MPEKPNLAASFTFVALYGALIAGLAALAGGVLAFLEADWLGAGASFGAAGLTFGLMANALVRR
jgi:hypothetical protein